MSTRFKLLLSLLACILCFVLLLTARPDYQPFSRLNADSITAIELDTGLGVIAHVDDEATLDAFSQQLSALMITRYADAEGMPLATLWVMRNDDSEFELVIYESHIIIDGVSCEADPAVLAALADLARRAA